MQFEVFYTNKNEVKQHFYALKQYEHKIIREQKVMNILLILHSNSKWASRI